MNTRIVRFCSDVGLTEPEPLEGSAIGFAGFIFISWPKGLWGSAQYDSEGLPADLIAFLRGLQSEKKIASRLVNHFSRQRTHCDIYIYPQQVKAIAVPVDQVAGTIASILRGEKTPFSEPDNANRLFCCTHGIRDRCCAKYGYGVVSELRRLTAALDVKDLFVHECTHLGGDRFAATAISFPRGAMYGRLRAGNLSKFFSDIVRERIHAPNYRGSVYLSGPRQLAEAWGQNIIHTKFASGTLDIVEEELVNPETRTLTVRVLENSKALAPVTYILNVVRRRFKCVIDCRQLDLGETKFVDRWVVLEARETSNPPALSVD